MRVVVEHLVFGYIKHAHRPFVTSNVALVTGVDRVLYPHLMSSLLSFFGNGLFDLLVVVSELFGEILNSGGLCDEV